MYWLAPKAETNWVSRTGPVAGAAMAPVAVLLPEPPVTVTVAVPVQVKLGRGEVASVLPVIVNACEPLARFSKERGVMVMIASGCR